MAIPMTYTSLFNEIKAYADRTNTSITDQIPNFIYEAEQRLSYELDGELGLEDSTIGSFAIGSPDYEKPDGWIRNLDFYFFDSSNQIRFLDLRSKEFCLMYSPDSTQYGVPKYYCDTSYEYVGVFPSPDDTYQYVLNCLVKPAPLVSGTNEQNWFTQNIPHALLNASLCNMARYQKNLDFAAAFEDAYAKIVAPIISQNRLRISDRSAERSAP